MENDQTLTHEKHNIAEDVKKRAAVKKKAQNILIRPANPDDSALLLEIYRPYVENTAITFEYDVPTEEEFKGRISKTLERYPYLIAIKDGQPAGYAYAGPFKERAAYDWTAEVSVYVAWDCRRQGIGRRLYLTLEEELRQMGIQNLEACIAVPPSADKYLDRSSAAFHVRLGYRMIGEFDRCGYKFGRWYNMVWMEKIIGTHSQATPIRPWTKT